MKYSVSIRFVFSLAWLNALFCVSGEDLDAALAAQKKKANRHVYSERAQIDALNVMIPKTQSEEEKALDRDLRRLENELDQQSMPAQGFAMQRPRRPVATTPKNWLTPTLLNSEHETDLPDEESSWIDQELERQQMLQLHKKELAEEEARVNQLLRETAQKAALPGNEISPSDDNPMLRHSLSPMTPNPASSFSDVLGAAIRSPGNSGRAKGSEFSLPGVRRNSGVIESSFSSRKPFSSQPTSVQKEFNRPAQKVNDLFSPKWTDKKAAPLSPLKRVRQSSPIHRKDPFTDDFMPEIKTSIWD